VGIKLLRPFKHVRQQLGHLRRIGLECVDKARVSPAENRIPLLNVLLLRVVSVKALTAETEATDDRQPKYVTLFGLSTTPKGRWLAWIGGVPQPQLFESSRWSRSAASLPLSPY